MPFPVRLAPYDSAWPLAFAREKAALERALADLGDHVVAIAHVGSTAVPGLVAKPVIDVLVGVKDVRPGDEYAERLAPLGLTWKRDAFDAARHLYQRREGARGVHVHIVRHGGREWTRELAFRNALREDAALRDAYVALKRKLAAEYPENGEAYANAKTPFIERVVGPARREA